MAARERFRGTGGENGRVLTWLFVGRWVWYAALTNSQREAGDLVGVQVRSFSRTLLVF